MKKDYYKILEIEKNASDIAIKTSFRKLAKKYHPDVCKDVDADKKFKEINEAYTTLSDPIKRREYDLKFNDSFGFYTSHSNENNYSYTQTNNRNNNSNFNNNYSNAYSNPNFFKYKDNVERLSKNYNIDDLRKICSMYGIMYSINDNKSKLSVKIADYMFRNNINDIKYNNSSNNKYVNNKTNDKNNLQASFFKRLIFFVLGAIGVIIIIVLMLKKE